MAKVLTVEDIGDLDDGDVISRFEGKITKLLVWKDDVGKSGDGTLQIFAMEDRNGDEITVKAWDHEEVPEDYEGKQVTILAHQGKSGKTGVFVSDETYKGKEQRNIRLTSSAEVIKGGALMRKMTIQGNLLFHAWSLSIGAGILVSLNAKKRSKKKRRAA